MEQRAQIIIITWSQEKFHFLAESKKINKPSGEDTTSEENYRTQYHRGIPALNRQYVKEKSGQSS